MGSSHGLQLGGSCSRIRGVFFYELKQSLVPLVGPFFVSGVTGPRVALLVLNHCRDQHGFPSPTAWTVCVNHFWKGWLDMHMPLIKSGW